MTIAAAKSAKSAKTTMSLSMQSVQTAVNDGLLHNAMRGPNGTHHMDSGPAMGAAVQQAAAADDAGRGADKDSPK